MTCELNIKVLSLNIIIIFHYVLKKQVSNINKPTNQPGILGMCPEVLIISPAFMFSVARMYFNWSLPATRAILAVLHPSSMT